MKHGRDALNACMANAEHEHPEFKEAKARFDFEELISRRMQ
jgi:hypothetical protein